MIIKAKDTRVVSADVSPLAIIDRGLLYTRWISSAAVSRGDARFAHCCIYVFRRFFYAPSSSARSADSLIYRRILRRL